MTQNVWQCIDDPYAQPYPLQLTSMVTRETKGAIIIVVAFKHYLDCSTVVVVNAPLISNNVVPN